MNHLSFGLISVLKLEGKSKSNLRGKSVLKPRR